MNTKTPIEDFAQLLMDSNPQFIFWKDTQGTYLGCNKHYAQFCNLNDPADIIGTTDYDYMSKEEAAICIAADQEVIHSRHSILNFEECVTDAHGVARWYTINKVPLKDADGLVVGVLGTMTDVTEIKEKNKLIEQQGQALLEKMEDLKRLNSKLAMANIDLEQFAYSTSHDLREPLRTIGGFVGLIEKKYASVMDAEGLEYLTYIKEGTTRMSSLINEILSYSKIEKVEEHFTGADFATIVRDVLKDIGLPTLNGSAFNGKSKVTLKLPPQRITCQPQRIKMLFHNLITNGLKFNTSNIPQVDINFEEKESEWLFHVSDNGIGIEESYQEQIFKPFKRLNTRDKFPGNGIGLSICKRIVYLHGGEIFFEPNALNGTSFYFTISKDRAALA